MRGTTELIVDIGSASIGTCVALQEHSKTAISYTARTQFNIESGEARAGIQEVALRSLKTRLENVPHGASFSHIHVVLGDLWYASKTKRIVASSLKPLRISMATVLHAVLKQRSEDPTALRAGRRSIESLITQIYVNGYPTTLEKIVRGVSLETHLYESEADDAFVTRVLDILKNTFPHVAVTFHTRAFTTFAVLRALRDEDSFVFAEVGGETTEVAIAHRDALRSTASFPVGSLSFARDIASGGSITDALSRMDLFAKGELSGEETARLKPLFEKMSSNWRNEYEKFSDEALASVPVPHVLFLMGEDSTLPWLEKMIEETAGTSLPAVITIRGDFFQQALSLSEGGAYDVPLSFAALFSSLNLKNTFKA